MDNSYEARQRVRQAINKIAKENHISTQKALHIYKAKGSAALNRIHKDRAINVSDTKHWNHIISTVPNHLKGMKAGSNKIIGKHNGGNVVLHYTGKDTNSGEKLFSVAGIDKRGTKEMKVHSYQISGWKDHPEHSESIATRNSTAYASYSKYVFSDKKRKVKARIGSNGG